MPLPIPTLDSRTWDELMTEASAVLPERAPGWTDYNLHDPGITLVELAAWLTEGLLFQLDRVTPEQRRGFLRLVGIEPRPAGVAATVVAFRRDPGLAAVRLPAGFQVTDAGREAAFESAEALTVSGAWLELDAAEATRRGELVREPEEDVTAANTDARRAILPFGDAPRPGDALRLGFTEAPFTGGEELALHVWTPAWRTDAATDARIARERRGHYGATVAWEYLDAAGWHAAKLIVDETRALTVSGRVVLHGPECQPPVEGRFWLRVRLAAGAYDCPPRLQLIAVNAARVQHAARTGPEALGACLGGAGETFTLAARPVVAGSTRLRLAGDDAWAEVATWDRTGPDDRHYRLDPEHGTITFGDGRRGRVPADGTEVSAAAYAVGGGPAGNVPARRLTLLAGDPVGTIVQPLPATGGAPAEPLARTHGRALDKLAAVTRGVSAEDLERLALETPGAPVGRVRALPGHHPDIGCVPAAGVVTVVVLPACGRPPRPTAAMLCAVCRHLEPRRLLGTELHVVAPAYVAVTVTATLHARRGAPADLAQRADAALAAFLSPLTGGADGHGWPFGRDVLESEVLAELSRLPGVRWVDGVAIAGAGGAPRCGNLALCPTELPDSRPHHITVQETS